MTKSTNPSEGEEVVKFFRMAQSKPWSECWNLIRTEEAMHRRSPYNLLTVSIFAMKSRIKLPRCARLVEYYPNWLNAVLHPKVLKVLHPKVLKVLSVIVYTCATRFVMFYFLYLFYPKIICFSPNFVNCCMTLKGEKISHEFSWFNFLHHRKQKTFLSHKTCC